MTTMYRACVTLAIPRITKVKVIKQTKKSLWFRDSSGALQKKDRQCYFCNTFDSFEEAKNNLYAAAVRKVADAQIELDKALHNMEAVKAMYPEDAEWE